MSEYLCAYEGSDTEELSILNSPVSKLHFRFNKIDSSLGDKSTHDLQLLPANFNILHKKVVSLADTYAEIKALQEDALSTKFMDFKREYAGELPRERKEWNNHMIEVSSKIRNSFHLCEVEVVGRTIKAQKRVEDFLDEIGVALVILPKTGNIKSLDGFAMTFCGTPIITLVQKEPKDYRRMFFTLGHELYHLLYAEGEDLANIFAGALFISQNKLKQNIKHPENLEKDMPTLLEKFPYNSAWGIANTACDYKLISEDERKTWNDQQRKKNKAYKSIGVQPYSWQSRVLQFKNSKPDGIDEELYHDYLEAVQQKIEG